MATSFKRYTYSNPGRGRTAGNGRKAQESAGNWKQYSSWKLPDFLPVDSDQLPD
ncbi:unnamed protein product, partial [Rotaria socialis]